MALHCLIMTALEETEYISIALRDFVKLLQELKIFSSKKAFLPSLSSQLSSLSRFLKVLENWVRQYFITYSLKTWFMLTRSKQNWPLKWKNKSLLFLPPSASWHDRVWFAFIWWHFTDRRAVADPDPQIGGGVSKNFGLKIMGARAPKAPPLDPPLEECWEKHLTWIICDKIRCA